MQQTSKIALVTGANKGVGKEISRQLAMQGVTVLLGARDRTRGAQAEAELKAQGLSVRYIQLDVTVQQSVDQAAAQVESEYGRLDILVNNAAIALDWIPPSELEVEMLRQTYDTNVLGVFRVTRAMIPLLKRSKAGRIVNVSSGLGSFALTTDPNSPFKDSNMLLAYSSSKSALNLMTLLFAKDLRDSGIKVNAVTPGYTATDMNQHKGNKTVEQGAATPVRIALLGEDGPTGGFFSDEGVVPW